MSFTSIQLALNNVSPSPLVLGTLNAIALTLTSAVRAVTPGAITPVFAVGVGKRILGGQLIWVVLIAVAAVSAGVVSLGFPVQADGEHAYRAVQQQQQQQQQSEDAIADEDEGEGEP